MKESDCIAHVRQILRFVELETRGLSYDLRARISAKCNYGLLTVRPSCFDTGAFHQQADHTKTLFVPDKVLKVKPIVGLGEGTLQQPACVKSAQLKFSSEES